MYTYDFVKSLMIVGNKRLMFGAFVSLFDWGMRSTTSWTVR
jgi:hypothetical protein